jgi:hypothetical protein
VVEVSRDIFDIAVPKCIWKEPANPNFSCVYGPHIVTQPFTTDDPLICRYHFSVTQVLRATYQKYLEESTSAEVREWLEIRIAAIRLFADQAPILLAHHSRPQFPWPVLARFVGIRSRLNHYLEKSNSLNYVVKSN